MPKSGTVRKPIEDKTPLAAWATLARDEAQMSVEEVVDALAARGHTVKAATIRGIEGGSKGASARLRRLLAEVYGTKPPGAESATAPTVDADRIIAAIDLLRLATEAQTKVLEERLGHLPSALDGYADGLQQLLSQLVSEHVNNAGALARLRADDR